MEYEFTKGIHIAIQECIDHGRGRYDFGTGTEVWTEWEEWEPELYIIRVYFLEVHCQEVFVLFDF